MIIYNFVYKKFHISKKRKYTHLFLLLIHLISTNVLATKDLFTIVQNEPGSLLPLIIERPDRAVNIPNMYYEYDANDINELLLLRAQEVGLDLNSVILIPPLDNMGVQLVIQLRDEIRRFNERKLATPESLTERVILIPLNLNGLHWVGLVLRLNTDNQVLRIQYIDPYETMLGNYIPVEIRELLTEVYGRDINIESLVLLRQTDETACGALTVENLIRAAQGNNRAEVAHQELTREIRRRHVELMERFRPELQFNLIQANVTSTNAVERHLESSYRTQHNDLLFYHYKKESSVIFILGTSSSGKTSIIKHLCSLYNNGNVAFTGSDSILDTIRRNSIKDYEDLLRKAYEFCDTYVLENIEKCKAIVADVVDPYPFLWALERNFIRCRICSILIYCNPKILSKRILLRNEETIKGAMNDLRLFFPFHQYFEIFERDTSGRKERIAVRKEDFTAIDFFEKCCELVNSTIADTTLRCSIKDCLAAKQKFQEPYCRKISSWFEDGAIIYIIPKRRIDLVVDTTDISTNDVVCITTPLFDSLFKRVGDGSR